MRADIQLGNGAIPVQTIAAVKMKPHATRLTTSLLLTSVCAMVVCACGDRPTDPPAQPGLTPSAAAATHPSAPRFEVHVAKPTGPPRVATDRVDALGRPITVGCATCHSLGVGDSTRAMGATLTQFHQALVTRHGELACRSCHEAPDYANLHLADGTTVPFTDVQTLCRQCHGPQARDFDRGSHGGMNGYWDLTRGPRQRHACTTCHDPHAPAYVGMVPARGPVPQHFGGE